MLQNGCCGRINNNPAIPTDFFLSSLVYQIITYCHLTVSVSQGVDSQGNLVFLKYSQLSLRLDHPALLSNGRYTAEVRLEDGRPKRRGTFWPTDSLFYMAPITCSGACVYVHMCVHMCVETPQVSYHLILYCRGNSCWQVHASPPHLQAALSSSCSPESAEPPSCFLLALPLPPFQRSLPRHQIDRNLSRGPARNGMHPACCAKLHFQREERRSSFVLLAGDEEPFCWSG